MAFGRTGQWVVSSSGVLVGLPRGFDIHFCDLSRPLLCCFAFLSFDILGRVNSHDNGLSDRSFVFVSDLCLTRLVILTFLSKALVFWSLMSVVLRPGPSPSELSPLSSSVG